MGGINHHKLVVYDIAIPTLEKMNMKMRKDRQHGGNTVATCLFHLISSDHDHLNLGVTISAWNLKGYKARGNRQPLGLDNER